MTTITGSQLFVYCFIIIFGLFWGSFGYSLFLRIPQDISLWKRSFCPQCKAYLKFWALIPIFSWIFLGGKCSKCHNKIPIIYLLSELGGALLAVIIFLKTPLLVSFFFWYIIWFLLIVNAIIDLKHYWLSSYLLLAGLLFGLGELFWQRPWEITDSLIGLLAGAGAFYFIRFIYSTIRKKEALGEGDVTLAGLLGLSLKWQSLLTLTFLAATFGIIVILLLAFKNHKRLSQPVPFAIFMVTVGFLLWLFPELRNIFDYLKLQ